VSESKETEIKGIDFAQAMKIVNNNLKLYVRLLENFMNSGMDAKFFEFMNKGDAAGAAQAAHAIKGVSANLSITDVNKVFARLEDALKKGIMPQTNEIAEARQTYNAALETIKTLVSNPSLLEGLKK